MAFGWEGEKVRLVPTDPERHLENAYRWINNPDVTRWMLVGDYPITREGERQWFEHLHKPEAGELHFAIETLEGIHIGFSGLHRIDARNGFATSGTFIGAQEHWGKGYGTDAARVRARYGFEVLGLRMVMSSYLEGNVASQKMQSRIGYREIGRYPKRFWKRGEWRDEVLTLLERENFRS